jgi:isopenicillin-N epimerase
VDKTILGQLFLLDPAITFLNHGSFGATPRPVFEAYQRWQLELEKQPVEFLGRRSPGLLRAAREKLGEFLHTASDNLVYITNATTGMNIVARSLRLGPGDEILTTDHEYGAVDRTWQYLAKRCGFQIKVAQLPLPLRSAAEIVETLKNAISKRTRLVSISHITSPTAVIFPIKEICSLARSSGILSAIDGAHSPGQIDLNLDDVGTDFYVGNLHKWLCAPKGSAFLYTRPESQYLIEPLIVSWGWASEIPGPSSYIDHLENIGTRDLSAFLAVPDAISFHSLYLHNKARLLCHELATNTQAQISALTGIQPLHLNDGAWFCQMAASLLPASLDPNKIKEDLYTKFKIEIPVFKWKDRIVIRYSYQIYNSMEDKDLLLQALAEILSSQEHYRP